MDGFVELVWENDEIVKRRPSTFILSQRGSAAARGDDSPSHTHGHMLHNYKKRANISSIHNSSTVNNHLETSNSTPTRNVFELFSSPTPTQQKQLASADRDEERNRPLLLNLIKTSGPPPPHHQQQPKRVKRSPLADAHAMYLVPDAHDDQDDRQTPILDQDHQNYHYHNHNQEEALVPSLNSGEASNDHHQPNTLQSVEQDQVPQTLTRQVSAPRATRAKRDAPTTKLHKLSERRRREKINKKIRALQALIPNCNKADKASILDNAIAYLKTLQLQLQMMMSMGTGLNQMHPMMLPNNGALVPHLSYFSPISPITSRLGVQMFGFPVSAPQPSFMPWHVPPSLQVPRFQTPNYLLNT